MDFGLALWNEPRSHLQPGACMGGGSCMWMGEWVGTCGWVYGWVRKCVWGTVSIVSCYQKLSLVHAHEHNHKHTHPYTQDLSQIHSWVGIIMYLPTDDATQRKNITSAFFDYKKQCAELLWSRYDAQVRVFVDVCVRVGVYMLTCACVFECVSACVCVHIQDPNPQQRCTHDRFKRC